MNDTPLVASNNAGAIPTGLRAVYNALVDLADRVITKWGIVWFAYLCVRHTRDKRGMIRLMWQIAHLSEAHLYELMTWLEADLLEIKKERQARK